MFKYGKLLVLALGLCVSTTACDESGYGAPSQCEAGTFRTGGLGTGATLTLNTSKWVSSAARDVFEFSVHDQWHTNDYGYEIKLATLTLPQSPYGPVTSPIGLTPAAGDSFIEPLDGEQFGVRVYGPQSGDGVVELTGADIVGLQLEFTVQGLGSDPHAVVVEFVGHHADPTVGDLYELDKVDPSTGMTIAPLCELDGNERRLAMIYDGLTVNGTTGAIAFAGEGLRHIACTSSAPGKATQFGYDPAQVPTPDFMLANRVIRADYCADGHPYTFPGNLVAIEDNVSPGQEGKTIADVYASLGDDEALEAVWDEHGVLCMDDPRAPNVEREDIVCPIKRFEDGSMAYSWRPPSCASFVDPDPSARRFFSKSAI